MSESLLHLLRRVRERLARLPLLPGRKRVAYGLRLSDEQERFDRCLEVHDLPEIFHYWSNRYLVPMFEPHGFTNPDDFFLRFIREKSDEHPERQLRVVSIGAGNCDLEIGLAERLTAFGVRNYRFDCVEINRSMIARAQARLAASAVAGEVRFQRQDFNSWRPSPGEYDVVMANQSLHHVLELEHLFDAIRQGLAEGGLFLASDMIGRNGHQRWPEALEVVNAFWEELPDSCRYNHLMQRQEPSYINHDCSVSGFEGVRAQDILPLLLERFHFRLFLPYGNAVFVFIDRAFGHNFDAAGEWDRAFVDRVHAADERGIFDGRLKPTSMLAAMTLQPCATALRDARLTPGFCVRDPGA